LFLQLLLLPPLFFYLGAASSMALGASIAALIIIATLVDPALLRSCIDSATVGRPVVLALLIVVGVAIHALIACLFLPFDFLRAGASVIPLLLTLMSGYALGRTLGASSNANVDGAIRICFAVFCLVGILAIIGLVPPNSDAYFKPAFPFTEPSYFALAFTPLLMYCCATSAGIGKTLLLLSGLAAALLLENFTMLIGCLLVAYISFRRAVVLILLAGAALAATQLDLSYYLDRLDFSSETRNLSSLVYLQGWQLIDESFTRSGGWGLGFQQLGVQGTNAPSATLIYDLTAGYSNLLDGGFTFAKVVSEFGVLGLLLIALYLRVARRAARSLRQRGRAAKAAGAAQTFSRCVIASYSLEIFVRGGGYFAGTAILLIASLWLTSAESPRYALGVKPVLQH